MAVRSPRRSGSQHATLGVKVKSGWAAVVLMGGSRDAPVVLDAVRLELADPETPASMQPYHAGFGTPQTNAQEVRRLVRLVERWARRRTTVLLDRYQNAGQSPASALIVGTSDTDPATITNPHIRIHGLEGQLFRRVVQDALRAVAYGARESWSGISSRAPSRRWGTRLLGSSERWVRCAVRPERPGAPSRRSLLLPVGPCSRPRPRQHHHPKPRPLRGLCVSRNRAGVLHSVPRRGDARGQARALLACSAQLGFSPAACARVQHRSPPRSVLIPGRRNVRHGVAFAHPRDVHTVVDFIEREFDLQLRT